MTANDQKLPTATILDLPMELIVNICRFDTITMKDIFNLSVSHPKLNNCLFGEQNNGLWNTKYIQKYGSCDNEEFEIVIDEQNNWRNEIMMRMNTPRAVISEIAKMSDKYLKLIKIPYHLYPFGEQLNSKYHSHRYYVVNSSVSYYKRLRNVECYHNVKYMAYHFHKYACQIYYGYKVIEFLSILPAEQTMERGFYLIGRWWSTTNTASYYDIANHFNKMALTVSNLIKIINPEHPLFKYENVPDQINELGKTNLDHDLFNEADSILILNCLRKVVFVTSHVACFCVNEIHCFVLQEVIKNNKGSIFMLCIIYEAIARRLGVKVKFIATSVHNFVSWTSSWPKNKQKNPTCYIIDVANGAILRESVTCPVSRKFPAQFEGNCISHLFLSYCKLMEQQTVKKIDTYKYLLDFEKLLRPDDINLEFKCQNFHNYYNYCRCPLLRDSTNRDAPNHVHKKDLMYKEWENIFPSIPKTRGTDNDPKYSIGMIMSNILIKTNSSNSILKSGIIVGWTKTPDQCSTIYHIFIKIDRDFSNSSYKYHTYAIHDINAGKCEDLRREYIPFEVDVGYTGKFFKRFNQNLGAYVPIDSLAQIYPDDYSFTIKSRKRQESLVNFIPKYSSKSSK